MHPPVRPAVFRLMAITVGTVVANLYYAQPLLPDIAREFHLTAATTGTVAMLGMAGASMAQLVFVPLGDIRERRFLISGMIGAAALALLLMATAQSVPILMLATFLCGASASVNHITTPFAAQLAPDGARGKVVGTVLGGLLVGILISRTYSGWIGEVFGWRTVFYSASVIMIVMASFMFKMLPMTGRSSSLTWPQLVQSIVPLWREQRVLREAVLINTLMFCVFSGFWTAMVFFVEGPPYNYTSKGAGMFGLIGAAGALSAPLAGRLVDRSGGKRNVLYSIFMMLAAYIIMAALGTNLIAFILGVLLLDIGQQFGHVSNQTRIYGLVPEARSRLNMIYMTCSFTGGALGSYFCTYFWNLAGWLGVCAFSITLLVGALGIWWTFNRTQAAPPSA